jgi:predicted phosphate transport protein (TIGR00153 family)
MFWQKKEKSFFDYFEEHAHELEVGSQLLQELFSNGVDRPLLAKQIKASERRADDITHQVVKQMDSSSFILPLDREDILNFIKTLDDVLDFINMTSEAYIDIYNISEATSYAKQFASVIRKSVSIIVAICPLLRSPSKNGEQILKHCIEIHRLENEGDDLKKDALRWLFASLSSQEIPIPTYIAWNDIYRTLEFVTDRAEDCANIAEQIVLKYS